MINVNHVFNDLICLVFLTIFLVMSRGDAFLEKDFETFCLENYAHLDRLKSAGLLLYRF